MIETPGINRNILECKGQCVDEVDFDHPVLIETYWNVKNLTRQRCECIN